MSGLSGLFKGLKKGFGQFGHYLNIIINSVLLFIVYVFGVGLTFFLSRVFKKHFMDMKLSKDRSYWTELNLKKKEMDEYYRQF